MGLTGIIGRAGVRGRLLLAFGAVYLIWGSTYLAIRIGIETLPPFLMAGTRFLLAGIPFYVWARRRGAAAPTWAHWRSALLIGGLMLFGGNGLVTVAEKQVPSSVAALIITSVPLWMTLLDGSLYGGRRPGLGTWIGLLLGLAGMVILIGPRGDDIGAVAPWGAALLLLASFSWANGSLLSRRVQLPRSPALAVSMEMLAAGGLLLLAAGLRGEFGVLQVHLISGRSLLALLYLAVFGSIVALSAYMWLLRSTTAAAVSTYAFVNPVVAVALGWFVADEPITSQTLLAAALIVVAVAFILYSWSRAERRPKRAETPRCERRDCEPESPEPTGATAG